MKYLVLGSKGQLGKRIIEELEFKQLEYKGFDYDEIDVTDNDILDNLILNYKPDYLINCTAYNQVDLAEDDKETAYNVNSYAVRRMAELCDKLKCKFIHYSSDYVFNGEKGKLYNEKDTTNPLNIYGESKLQGETFIKNTFDNWIIFRLSWVYGKGEQNFIHKLKTWASKNSELKIVTDEISVPTSVNMISDITFRCIGEGLLGLYHSVNSGYCSRYNWAKEILRLTELNAELKTAKIDDFNLKATRPKFSAMDNQLISKTLNFEIKNWQEDLEKFIYYS